MNSPMPDSHDSQSPNLREITFGHFNLFPAQRLLLKSGTRVKLGSRALDLLVALVAHAGKVISNRDLVRMVWQDVVVDESCLRVHISALRKALSNAESDAQYIANIPGRGYSFVACVSVNSFTPDTDAFAHQWAVDNLPPRLVRMVGRDETVDALAEQIKQQRFVTISASGGMGKTTVAVAVAHHLMPYFNGLLYFLDLDSINEPNRLAETLACALGVRYHSSNVTCELVTFLKDKRLLLVLDSCDQMIEEATCLAEKLFQETEQVHILATCREPLRAEGEHVYRLCPLACPPEENSLTASSALSFSAVQLFVERAITSGTPFILSDHDAPVVAYICRKLDGVALAIELGASRVDAHGIQGTAELLSDRFILFWSGRRTALSRHQTLNAMLEWSWNRLSTVEAMMLRQLSILSGSFSLDTIKEMVGTQASETIVIDAIGRLVAKCLISVESISDSIRYRLLFTTRVYALDKLRTSGEAGTTAKRHAVYFLGLLERMDTTTCCTFPEYEQIDPYIEHLDNIRAALSWAFSLSGDPVIGIRLAATSVPLFLGLSILNECRHWCEQALAALGKTNGTHQEMVLQEAFAISLMLTYGNTQSVRVALTRGLELAEHLGDTPRQLRLLAGVNIFLTRGGEFQSALVTARQNMKISARLSDPKGIAMAQWMLGVSCHLVGQQAEAQKLCTAGLALVSSQPHGDAIYFGYDHHIRALVSLAQVLWLRGYPDQAVVICQQALDDAQTLRLPVSICTSLIHASMVFLWIGDRKTAGQTIDKLILYAGENSLRPDQAVGMGLKGILFIRQGDVDAGLHLLLESLHVLSVANHQVLTTMFIRGLAEGFAAKGEYNHALEAVGTALTLSQGIRGLLDTPEILRIAADLHAHRPTPDLALAERYLKRSLACARHQSALAWELRSATSLTRLRLLQGRNNEAGKLLEEVYGRYSEGFDSMDLRTAKQLLQSLNRPEALDVTTWSSPVTGLNVGP
ncbi:MAG: ATP-binding protein [Pseudomonas sp.]